MKCVTIAVAASLALVLAVPALSKPRSVSVKAHTRSDGTYVPAHYRTAPNSTRNDNWSTTGNRNPYTAEEGRLRRDEEGRGSGASYASLPEKIERHPCEGRYVGGIAAPENGFCVLN